MLKRFEPLYAPDGVASYFPQSWGDALKDASESIDDQPVTESEDEVHEEDVDAGDDEESNEESDEDQPDQESEDESNEEPEDPEIELGGERKPVKLSELKDGYMRMSDYTKKTTEIATLRKEVEAQTEALKPIQQWHDHINQNPWLWQQLNAAIEEFGRTEVLPLEEVLQDAQYGKYINHLVHENNKLKADNQKLSGDFEGIKLTSDMGKLQSELATEYGDLVTPEYMQSLQERAKTEKLSTSTLKEIAEGYLAKEKLKSTGTSTKKTVKEAEAKAIQKLAETRKQSPPTPKAKGQTPKDEVSVDGSWSDFFKRTSGR